MLGYRGFMLDTGRKFFPLAVIFQLLDILGTNQFNIFHWHIYDSQMFPIQWKYGDASYMYTNKSEKYTTADIQKVISYANEKGIKIIPELEMPGNCFN